MHAGIHILLAVNGHVVNLCGMHGSSLKPCMRDAVSRMYVCVCVCDHGLPGNILGCGLDLQQAGT